MNAYRRSNVSAPPAPTIIESYPYRGLPAPGSAGRLARVTDKKARLWLDDGVRWSPLVDNTVNVLSVGPVDPKDAKITTPTLQAALKTGLNVYLPAGVYPINETLEFHSGQTIFGDSRHTTSILADAAITMLRSDTYPELTRDVVFRDLSIDVDTTLWWHPETVGIDFTGVGFSRLERLSMRGHGTAMTGRDGALRTYVRAGSADTWLHVTATDTLYTGNEAITIRWKDTTGQWVVLKADVTDVAEHDSPNYPALAVRAKEGAPPLPPLNTIPLGSAVFHDDDHIGGYYNTVVDCEIADCIRGISLTNDGNNWTVLDGHFGSNICGIYLEFTDGARIRSTFEHNGVGVEFGPGATTNTVLAGSYFEGNGQADAWNDVPVKPVALGAVRCHPGSNNNTIEPCLLSNGTDYVVDEADDGNNTCSSPHLPAFPAMPSGVGGGSSIVSNGDFAVWTQASGLPDGWRSNRPVPNTMRFAPETAPANVPAGTGTALRWNMSHGQNMYFSIYRELAVVPGQWYTFTARTMVDTGGDKLYTMTLATATSFSTDQELYHTHPMPAHDYNTGLHRHAFRVPDNVKSIYLILRNVNTSTDRGNSYCEVDAESATAWFGKFQLEPGRGVSTESRDSGLMGHVQTSGGLLTIDADTASIPITHPFHNVAPGPKGVLTKIVPPAGFSGMVVLKAAGAWTATTDGIGPGRIGTPLTMTAGKTVIGWYDTGTATWWFTQS